MIAASGSVAAFWWRLRPGAIELAALDAALACDGPRPAVFLQGRAVDWLSEPTGLTAPRRAGADWQVCIGSWRRRNSEPLPAPFRPATLARWIDRICPDRSDRPGPELVFDVGRAPVDGRDRIETLEPILAAASLDRDVTVLVHGQGRDHLAGPGSEAWDQLADFELAALAVVCAADDPRPRLGNLIGPERAARLRDEAFKLVTL
ncbi:hypothetical protein HFP89_12240 [Wenzhouxiangella sp. XN79A]|uniref:hypothetical protein n=1 Tax=Wenzhouxiangella sp. XN79A TaxID=2724193 RepID=UPI00144AAC0C|nr:hypothetical protein [Wenzhouxiangella sp. XN79A]NKI35932.1 hypothetical protein [Wenzhouxiangella sp. XN79A]